MKSYEFLQKFCSDHVSFTLNRGIILGISVLVNVRSHFGHFFYLVHNACVTISKLNPSVDPRKIITLFIIFFFCGQNYNIRFL